MRVIAGLARGRPLIAPGGTATRPTADKVKGALFSMLETQLVEVRPGGAAQPAADVGTPELWEGVRVLDLFAGSGALGIEALSRGAAWCDFVESELGARQTIERNLRATGYANQARVIAIRVEKLVASPARELLRSPYDLILLDPPYDLPGIEPIVVELAGSDLLAENALVAVEHSVRRALASEHQSTESTGRGDTRLTTVRERKHGDTVLTIYRRERSDEGGDVIHGYASDLSG